jgi:membrane associated rhomboid family serine protease
MNPLSWLRKVPIMSVMIASAMIATPFLLGSNAGPTVSHFEEARDDARDFLVHNPSLEVDSLGALILDAAWLEEARAAAEASGSSADVELPSRMLARSQAKLDGLIELAYSARMNSDPVWRLGVLDARTPSVNYFAHAFVHESIAGVALCIAVLLLVSAPLERTWGSAIFALFSIIAIPLTAQGYRLLDSSSGIPWSGSAGLAGALLGAYCIRGLGGHFILPGWVLLPMWLGVESFVVREFWIDDLGGVPWASFCASIGFGALVAGALRLVGIESALHAHASKGSRNGPNPIISRAARLRSDGDPYQAFDLMQAAWRDDPADRDVAEAFFSIAAEVDQVGAAADAILPSLNEALRSGDTARAIDYWIPLASSGTAVELDAIAAVRLGEALHKAEQPRYAIRLLQTALEAGVSSSHALRIVKVARGLDAGLARRAAKIALGDVRLDPATRAELEPIAALPADGTAAGIESGETETAIPETTESLLGRRVAGEHQAVKTTWFPIAEDKESALALPSVRDPATDVESTSSNETRIIDQNLDPNALSVESLRGVARENEQTTHVMLEGSGDVLSHWSDQARIDDVRSDFATGLDLDSDFMADDAVDLVGQRLKDGDTADLNGEPGGETDTDLTPLIEASEELTSPFVFRAPAGGLTMLATNPRSTAEESAQSDSDFGDTAISVASTSDKFAVSGDFAIGVDASRPSAPRLRALRAVEAVPVADHEEWIDMEVDDRGKSKLPIARIEAIIMAAISGLASRPILLVDFALNWTGDHCEPLKVVRFRSDRFDPRSFEPSETNPLESLTAWVRQLQDRSGATCLPSSVILDGEFARYDSVEDYESEVLEAMREV